MALGHSLTGAVLDRAYDFAGYRFRVVSDVEDAAGLAEDLLKQFEAAAKEGAPTYAMLRVPDVGDRYTFHRGNECLLDESRAYPAAMVDLLLSDVTSKAIEAQDDFLVVHASVASWSGRGILMPAATGSGKTTTVAGLVRAGFDYLSDEAALVSASTAIVHPFPRPLAMGAHSASLVNGLLDELPADYHEPMRRQQYYIPCDLVRAGSAGGPCPVAYVVSPSYSRGSVTEIEPMSRADALTLLAGQCFNLDRHASHGLSLLAEVVKGAGCFTLRIGDLSSAVSRVKELVGFDK
ncbi:MAG: hypothetical protein ACRDJV_05135 [Actinomycetota bacterium]